MSYFSQSMLKRKIEIIFFILSSFSLSLLAQNENIIFEQYTVDNGLSQSTANCLFQDSKGYLWIGTQDGLNRFNGKDFDIFYNDPLNSKSISNKWIYDITEDKKGNIWVATLFGLDKFNRRDETFQRFFHNKVNPRSIPENEIFGLMVDSKNNLWIRTRENLAKYDGNEFYSFGITQDRFVSKKISQKIPIIETPRAIWTTSTKGLIRYDKISGALEKIVKMNHTVIADQYITALAYDNKQILWVGTVNGLSKYNLRRKTFTNYYHDDNNENSLPTNSINYLTVDHSGNVWIGTDVGLCKFNPKKNEFVTYKSDPTDLTSLSYDVILSLLEDESHNLWIGTDGNGINKVNLKPLKFKLYRKTASKKSVPLSNNIIASVLKDDKGSIWIGTWGGGLNIYNPKTKQLKVYNSSSKKFERLTENHVHVILKISSGNYFLGTRNGITVYDPSQKKFFDAQEYYPNVSFPKFANTRIYSMIEDFRHNIWIATQSGLHKFNINTYEISSYYKNDGLCDNLVVTLFEDDMNQIWIGTANGLNIFDFAHPDKLMTFKASTLTSTINSSGEYSTISNNYIYSVKQGKKYFWIGTSSGLNRYDRARGKFKYYLKKDGLPNETIYEILIDKNDNLWMSTNRGIVELVTRENRFVAYDKGDGLQGLEFDNGASYKSKDGEFFFGGVNGLNSFYPDSIYNNDFPPKINFNYYTVISTKNPKINRTIFNHKTDRTALQENDTIVLRYTDKSLTIFFSALEFTNPQKNQYKYFLKGQDKDWTDNGNKNFAIFTNLNQGTYTFKIKGSNNDYVWSKEKSITIIVYPPLYKTIWAYLIYFVLLSGIILFFFRNRTNKLRMDNQLLRAQQTASMEIAKQREELQIKNKNIMDSINYAKRIQRGMMPTEYLLKHFFPQSFLFYRPRDVVSGDFYWFTEKNNKFFIATVDCTGHGVPGAFMSIIGINLLNNIIIDKNIENPGEILNLMNQGLYDNLNKEVDDITLRDGMDMSVCVIHNNSHKVEFSGAMNGLFLIRNNKLIEVIANRFSIGSLEPNERVFYETHTFDSYLGDMLYLFSDGFVDQFGGPKGKKYKIHRFRKLIMNIHGKSAEEQEKILDREFTDWKGTLEQVDDITIIGLRF